MIFIPKQREGDDDEPFRVRHHYCLVRLTEDPPWLPRRWRIRCMICKAHWVASGCDHESWLAAQRAAQFHAQTGRWPDADVTRSQEAA